MKRCFQLGALVAVLALSLLASMVRPAWAWNSCSLMAGAICSPNGSVTNCEAEEGIITSCRCIGSHWQCFL